VPDIPEEDRKPIRAHFTSLTPLNPVDFSEHRIIMPDGKTRWQWWSDRAIFDESGTLIEYQSVGRDVTDRKTAELELLKKNEDLHAAFEQLTAIEEELRQLRYR
jgi:PAS domain S-box-containing protein